MSKDIDPKYCTKCGMLLKWRISNREYDSQTGNIIGGWEILICANRKCINCGDELMDRPLKIGGTK